MQWKLYEYIVQKVPWPLTKAISGHSTPKTAMVMAIVTGQNSVLFRLANSLGCRFQHTAYQ